MKLLVLANSTVWAGAEIFLWRLCRELCTSGFPVVVVCPPQGPLASRFEQLPLVACHREKMGIHTARIRGIVGSLALMNPLAYKGYVRLLGRMQKRYGCDTALCQYPREQALVAGIAGPMGYRVAWIVHSKLHYLANRILVNPMLRRAIPQAAPAFIISGATKDALVGQGFPERPMKSLQVGVDAPSVDTPTRSDEPKRVGVVCRLVRLKGVQDILQAIPMISQEMPGVQIVVAGDGRFRTTLEKMTRQLGVTKLVRFLGFVENPWEVYRQLDVLAHATFDPGDSMPTNILEAAAVGVPAVATRWAGIPEIVRDGETGLLVAPRDVGAIRDALLRVLMDRAFASQLGENARTFVTSHFSMKTVAQTFISHLCDPCAAPRSGSALPSVPN